MPVVRPTWIATVSAVAVALCTLPEAIAAPPGKDVLRGRYLVAVAGCNDCHTAGYGPSGGKVPEPAWLTGDAVGFQGPWGVTYASNLRTFFQSIDEAGWIKVARSREFRPPMPTPSLRAMTDADLRALYRYVRSLGPADGVAAKYLPPGQAPAGPVIAFPAPPPK